MYNNKLYGKQLQATAELVLAAMVEKICDRQLRDFISAPIEFLRDNLQVDIPPTTRIKFYYNNDKCVNLTLPYYSVSGSSLQSVTETQNALNQGASDVVSVADIGVAIGASIGNIATSTSPDENRLLANHMQKRTAKIATHMTDLAYIVA